MTGHNSNTRPAGEQTPLSGTAGGAGKPNEMKKIIICLLFLSALCLPSSALCFDAWTAEDIGLQAFDVILTAGDWLQTRAIAKNPDKFEEKNIYLGKHPSTKRVDRFFLGAVIFKGIVTHILPQDWRKAWQGVTIGISAGMITHNDHIGISISKAF